MKLKGRAEVLPWSKEGLMARILTQKWVRIERKHRVEPRKERTIQRVLKIWPSQQQWVPWGLDNNKAEASSVKIVGA